MHTFGAHVSAAGGLDKAPANAKAIGADAFALFVKNQRQWTVPALTPAEVSAFQAALAENGYTPDRILPHAGYLINLANPDDAKQAVSLNSMRGEVARCQALGLDKLNFHPGSHMRLLSPEAACERTGKAMNVILGESEGVALVVENTAGSGGNIGSRFEELRIIRDTVSDKKRLGFCLDTAHAFGAGFDIRTRDGLLKMLDSFDKLVGLKFLRGMHLNDSMAKLGSHVDRHQSIGQGLIGEEAFKTLAADSRLEGIPLILETPDPDLWPDEIKRLKAWARR